MKKQKLLNTYINNLTMDQAVKEILDWLHERKVSYVVPVNVDVLVRMEKDLYLKEIADQADMTLADGKPLLWIAKFCKRPIKQKVSGSDLVPALFDEAEKYRYSVYILGGMGDVPGKAAKAIKNKWKGLEIAGFYAPPYGFEKNPQELIKIQKQIQEVKPDILLVCLGCPKQEKWVYENYKKTSAVVTICAGATVDFLAGTVRRAPGWVSYIGFEWFYRFLREPRRLFKRYFIDDMKVVFMVYKYYLGRKNGGDRE